jgi:hypothetical protein
MAHGAWPHLHDLRRQAVCALAVLGAALAIALAGMALAQPGHVAYRGAAPSLDARDVDAKALRPQQQLAYRGPGRSIRLGSSSGPEPFVLALRPALHTTARSAAAPAPHSSGASAYLRQRTRSPREPPLPVV